MDFEAERIFDHPRDFLFALLLDVPNYKHFVPFCKLSDVLAARGLGDGRQFLKVRYRFQHKRFGINVETISDSEIDNNAFTITSGPAPEDASGITSHGTVGLEELSGGRTRLWVKSTYVRKGLLDLFLPKRPFLKMLFNKFFDIVDARAEQLQSGTEEDAEKDTSAEFTTENDPRAKLLEALPKNSVGAELGVYLGAFAEDILKTVKPAKLHLVDPWRRLEGKGYDESWYADHDQEYMDSLHDLVCNRFRTQLKKDQVEIHRATAAAFLRSIPDESLDWVYIDGDHSYEAVAQDLILSYGKVRPGGLIAGDDYRIGGWWKDNIIRAVDEFCAVHPVRMTLDLHGQYILQKQDIAANQ